MGFDKLNRHLFVLVSFCAVVFVASFYVAVTKDSTAAYSLAVVSFVSVVSLYAAGVLGYKVGGNHLSLEATVSTLEKENTELKTSVTALVQSIYVMADGASRYNGPTAEHHKLVSQYIDPIAHFVNEGAIDRVKTDIANMFPKKNP